MKKFLSVVLSALLLISIIPMSVSAVTVVDSGNCGDNLTWTLDDEGTLTISGTGYMFDTPWSNHCDTIKSVIISDGITSIAFEAFKDCRNLQKIDIPDSVTTIEDCAFYNCRNLEKITIPDGVTTIGYDVFTNCKNLQEINIPYGVISIGGNAFSGCTSLQKITIPNSVKRIEICAFRNCTNLTEVFFGGTKDQWQKIFIDDENWCLNDAMKHFNCDPNNVAYTAVVTAPTCTQQGYTTYTCRCGTSYVADFVAEVHSYRQHKSGDIVFNLCTLCGALEKTNVIAQIERISHLAYFLQYRETDCETDEQKIDNSVFFDGKVTKHNIDGLLLIAFWNMSFFNPYSKDYDSQIQQNKYAPCSHNIPLDDINEMFYYSFGLENVDFSIAQRYDVDTEMFYSPGGYGFEIPLHIVSVENGQYVVRWYDFEEGTEEISKTPCMTVTFDKNAKYTGIYFPDIPDVIPENDHIYTSEITTSATHLTEGVMTYTCACGDTYTEAIAKTTEHKHIAVVTAPTCIEKGFTTYTCECGDSYTGNFTDIISHADADGDGKCDMCKTEIGEKEIITEIVEFFTDIFETVKSLFEKLLEFLGISL